MALFYLDASALVKLVREEPESAALRAFVADADLISSELVLAEVPRAIRRAAADDSHIQLEALIDRAGEVLDVLGLVPVDRTLLLAAGALEEPILRTLDAAHIVAAVVASPLHSFVTYDERQAAAARLAGLRTVRPGAAPV